MPPECLERIVYHASGDHRVLATLMQVNSTLFRMATPYLYHEVFNFKVGDDFKLDWDTETWTRHLRQVRHAQLLLLYLSCTETIQRWMQLQPIFSPSRAPTATSCNNTSTTSLLSAIGAATTTGSASAAGTLKSHTKSRRASDMVQMSKCLKSMMQGQVQGQSQSQSQRRQDQSSLHVKPQDTAWSTPFSFSHSPSSSPPSNTPSPATIIEPIPLLLENILRKYYSHHHQHQEPQGATTALPVDCSRFTSTKRRASTVSRWTDTGYTAAAATGMSTLRIVNYLDYVEHLDLDAFLSTAIQTLFSPSLSSTVANVSASSTAGAAAPTLAVKAAAAAAAAGKRRVPKALDTLTHHAMTRGHHFSAERAFVERVLLRATTNHITMLSLSITAFARLQRDLMAPLNSPNPIPSAWPSSTLKNSAGVRTGAPLSQLSRLCLSGMHAELKPKVLRAIRWFLRRHVAVYPGLLTSIRFQGPGDSIMNRRRQRNRNVVAAEPVQPGVVHFNSQDAHADENDLIDNLEEEEEEPQQGQNASPAAYQHQHQHHYQYQHHHHPDHLALHHHNLPMNGSPNGVLFVDAAGQINNVLNGGNNAATAAAAAPQAAVAFPAVFHSQYYLLSRNPDQSCELDFMCLVQELRGQLEVLDLSQWSWSVLTQQALDMIPTSHLITLLFHPRTRIQSPHGSDFLKRCSQLKKLEIHAFDSKMMNLDDDHANTTWPTSTMQQQDPPTLTLIPLHAATSTTSVTPSVSLHNVSSSATASLDILSLTGSVQNVLPAVSDAIRIVGPSLTSIDLSGHLDGFLSVEETRRLLDWNTSLSSLTLPRLTTLQLHGHLAMTFEAPLLLELCPTLRTFGLTIKSYTSSSFVRTDLARVLPRFMVPWDQEIHTRKSAFWMPPFQLKALELEGPWILTDRDMRQVGEQLCGLVELNLVGCRFYPTRERVIDDQKNVVESDYAERDPYFFRCVENMDTEKGPEHGHENEDEHLTYVVRLVKRIQGTLRILRIHRRGLEGQLHRNSADGSSMVSSHSSLNRYCEHEDEGACCRNDPPAEPVLAFKKQYPQIELLIQEKQHEHSFVLAPSAETLRRIHHHSPPRTRMPPTHFSNLLGQPSSPSTLHEFQAQGSAWRRARNALPFLNKLKRRPVYTPNGFENHLIRSWGRATDRLSWLPRRNGGSRGRGSIPSFSQSQTFRQ
ncbi:hypothetical protein EDD11_004188 [Mortierella claussenii]|nr:hypothetical protein EDD11_004188 [Mortierella claussenii]